MNSSRTNVAKLVSVLVLVLVALGAPWESKSQISGSSTGWCTDYEGNNFRCSDGVGGGGNTSGGGGSYGYGGGCATATQSNAAIARQNAHSSVTLGNLRFDDADYITAADMYYNAVQSDSSYTLAWDNLGAALSYVGDQTRARGDLMSALLYHERAVKARANHKLIRSDYEDALRYAPDKSCLTCGKAIESDIAYGLGTSASIYSYVHQATVNYDNCTRKLTCNDTDGSSFRYLARQSCYNTFRSSEDGFRACLQQALEDRGYTFW